MARLYWLNYYWLKYWHTSCNKGTSCFRVGNVALNVSAAKILEWISKIYFLFTHPPKSHAKLIASAYLFITLCLSSHKSTFLLWISQYEKDRENRLWHPQQLKLSLSKMLDQIELTCGLFLPKRFHSTFASEGAINSKRRLPFRNFLW